MGGCSEVSGAYFSQFCLEARPEPYFKPPTALNTMFGLSLERLGHSGMGAIIESEKLLMEKYICKMHLQDDKLMEYGSSRQSGRPELLEKNLGLLTFHNN